VFLQTDIRVTQFNYTDNSLTAGNYLYRLKLLDAAGKTKYSNILSFKTGMEAAEDKLVVYPSLVTEQFNVKFKSAKPEATLLEIFDFSGKKVYRKQLNLLAGENNIAVSGFNLIRGNYIVAVKSAEKILTQKISIQ
jgi:DNA polymerase/3'-5' exonuclease PolX